MAGNYNDAQIEDMLNRAMPANNYAKLGTTIYNLLNAYNQLQAQYTALLAHLDAANVAGIGTSNAATYGNGVEAVTLPAELP